MKGKKKFLYLPAFLLGLFLITFGVVPSGFAGTPHAPEHKAEHHWGYEGHTGPEHWGELKPEFKACSEGKSQSPIDITGDFKASKAKLELHYSPTKINVLNNGHTIKVSYDAGSYVSVNGERYNLVQFHFHGPSEHTVNGEHFPMEMHLVHQSKKGGYAVVGVLIANGAENKALAGLWSHMPEKVGQKKRLKKTVNAKALLPKDKSYYTYSGSFTTPPCTEGVKWLVMKNPIELSANQLKAFGKIMPRDNRPVQPLNGRAIGISGS
ncbi:MAG: carbonic anhydrase [Thermodesulfobacteriota bacterium]